MRTGKPSLTFAGLLLFAAVLMVAAPAWAYETLTHNGNGVSVSVTPAALTPDKDATFSITLDTHSVDLNQDLTAAAELRDDQGRRLQPRQWDGSPPGGHHRRGTLIFPALPSSAKSVTLIIRDVAGVPERTFTWQVSP